MKYKYYPQSYNMNDINEKFSSIDEFVEVQVLYRKKVEEIISSIFDFKSIDESIKNQNVIIPIIYLS